MKEIKMEQYIDLFSPDELKGIRDSLLNDRNLLSKKKIDYKTYLAHVSNSGHRARIATVALKACETVFPGMCQRLENKQKQLS